MSTRLAVRAGHWESHPGTFATPRPRYIHVISFTWRILARCMWFPLTAFPCANYLRGIQSMAEAQCGAEWIEWPSLSSQRAREWSQNPTHRHAVDQTQIEACNVVRYICVFFIYLSSIHSVVSSSVGRWILRFFWGGSGGKGKEGGRGKISRHDSAELD